MNSKEAAENLLEEYAKYYHWVLDVDVKKTEGKELLVVVVKDAYVRTGNAVLPWKYENFGVIVKQNKS